MRRPWLTGGGVLGQKQTMANIQSGGETLWELFRVQFPGSAREEMALERQGQANSESIYCSKEGLGTV